VPNDTHFGTDDAVEGMDSKLDDRARPAGTKNDHSASLHLITGPNMAGKSTYIRQVALLVLLAQAGSFVPAKSATIGIVDRIFTRVGAADDLAGGQSTFMVEMIETANILHHATKQSLVILDEIGRGTSTLDGLALAWAIAEYLAFTCKARTLFATHYHELTELAEVGPAPASAGGAVANYNVLVREWEDQIIFMHRIAPGASDKSYGVHVARLAGVPRSVVTRARQLMGQLAVHVGKGGKAKAAATAVTAQVGMFDGVDQQALTQLRALDMDRMSPMQAWEALRMLQGLLGEKKQGEGLAK
jgi:DNA mismatch repair protein MutS